MQVNTNSINSLIGVDHVNFNTLGSGIHQQVTFANSLAQPGIGDGIGVEFAQNFPTPAGFGTQAWPVWKNNAGAGGVQMLGAYPVASATGLTSLPGGIILQWGTVTPVTQQTLTIVNFLTPFLNACFVVLVTAKKTLLPKDVQQIYVEAKTLSNFSYFATITGFTSFDSFDWIAIGN